MPDKPIKVGLIRCDTHGAYYAALMAAHDPLKLRNPVPVGSDPPHSWMNGSVHYYFYTFCAGAKDFTVRKCDGFEITRVWDENRQVASIFSDVFDSHPLVCDSYEQASDDVDLVFIGDCNGDGSDHLALASPGIRKGVPTFIDKPLANDVKDVKAIVSLAKEHSTPIYSASILRHLPGAFQCRARLEEIGRANSGFVRGGGCHIAGQIHTISLIQVVFGNGIHEVRAMGPSDMGVVHVSWGNRTDRPRDGVVIHHDVSKSFHCSIYVSAYGPDGGILSASNINDWHFPFGAARILEHVKEMVQTRKADESMNDMIEAVAVVNAGRKSLKDSSRAVLVSEVSAD